MVYKLDPSPWIPYTIYSIRETGFDKLLLEDMIGWGDAAILLEGMDGKIGHHDASVENTTIRDSQIAWIPDTAYQWLPVFEGLAQMLRVINGEIFHYDLTGIYDGLQYTTYHGSRKGKYDWHLDIGHRLMPPRKLSFSLALSDPDEYEGGEFEINEGIIRSFRLKKGQIIFFPAYVLHRVAPVTKGLRRSIVGWAGGPAWR